LLLTVAKYKTPAGKKIQDEAITPTVVVGATTEDDEDEDAATPSKSDDFLKKALELLKAKNS